MHLQKLLTFFSKNTCKLDIVFTRIVNILTTTDRSKAVVPVLHLLSVALWLILRCDLYQVLPCVLSLCFSDLITLRSPRLGKRELVCVFFVHLSVLSVIVFVYPLSLGVRYLLRLVVVALP